MGGLPKPIQTKSSTNGGKGNDENNSAKATGRNSVDSTKEIIHLESSELYQRDRKHSSDIALKWASISCNRVKGQEEACKKRAAELHEGLPDLLFTAIDCSRISIIWWYCAAKLSVQLYIRRGKVLRRTRITYFISWTRLQLVVIP